MNRRKFLSVGGMGLLGVNTLVYGVSPGWFETEISVADQFVALLGAQAVQRSKEDHISKSVEDAVRELFSMGYQMKKDAFFMTKTYYLVCLELKRENHLLDEVVVVFVKSDAFQKTGTINAQQMNGYLEMADTINIAGNMDNSPVEDWVLPVSPKRFADNGLTCFFTKMGTTGCRIDIGDQGTRFHGMIKDKKGNVLAENSLSSTGLYPETIYI